MTRKYTGTLSLDWYNKQKSIVTQKMEEKSPSDIPAPRINWVNREDSIFYEIFEEEGKGQEPFWVERNDVRVKEARPLVLKKTFKVEEKKSKSQATSYSVKESTTDDPDIENMLIKGDNLLALNSLVNHFSKKQDHEKVKCIFIDPPYNTGAAFEHYPDNFEHSMWLSIMRDRLERLKKLLSDDGSIWIILDDRELYNAKLFCDEVFGSGNFIGSIIWRSTDNSNNNAKTFSTDHNTILVYGKNSDWLPYFLHDESKRTHFKNPDGDPDGPWFDGNPVNNPALRKNLQFDIKSPTGHIIKHPPNGWRWSRETIDSKLKTGELRFSPDGKRLIRRTYLKDQKGLPSSSLWLWTELSETGHNRQAKYELKNLYPDIPTSSLFSTPKPERLIAKVLESATVEGDLVLDCFLGSGTTAAVAHKMGRRWIGVEVGNHADSYIIPRLKKVMTGEDNGGISKQFNWQGGGAFKYYHLGPSIISTKKGEDDFNWKLGKHFIQDSLLATYDYIEDSEIDLSGVKAFRSKENRPSIGFQKLGNKVRVAIISLQAPEEKVLPLSLEEVSALYEVTKNKYSPEYINIFTNRGVEIAFDSKPDDLEVIKVPHAIFADLEK